MLNNLKQQLRKIKWLYIYPLSRSKKNNTELNKYLRSRYGIGNVSVSKLKTYKTSDTLFILAAGQSINNIEESHFKEISKCDSIGVNGFAHHNFVPTFHSFELENQHSPIALEMFLETSKNIIRLKEEYKNTAIIFRQHKIDNKELESNVEQIMGLGHSYWNIHDQMPGKSLEEYQYYLKAFKKKGLFNEDDFFPNKSSSMSWVVSMAYQLKYKKIIFCGVDLVGDHFYKNNSPLDEAEFDRQKNKRHLTGNLTQKYPVVIQDLIKFWDNEFFRVYDAKVYVSSKYSLLSEILPVYNFKSQ